MKKRATSKERFEAILHECDAHKKRLMQAKDRCAKFFPLSAKTYEELSDEQVEHVDQMVYRFTKLQDALGAKLFPSVVSVLREDAASLTVFDVLAELEKAGAIPNANRWVATREMRNQLAHDYQDNSDEGSRSLNDLFSAVDELIGTGNQATAFVRERVLPSH